MSDTYKEKINKIFIPFIVVIFTTLIAYVSLYIIFINWLDFNIKEEIADLFIPFGLTGIVVFVLLSPKIKLLVFKKNGGDIFYYIIPALWIFFLIKFVISFITYSPNSTVNAYSVNELRQKKDEVFFNLQTIEPDTSFVAHAVLIGYEGKLKERTVFEVYCTMPIKAKGSSNNSYWLCEKFKTSESNRDSENDLNKQFNEFIQNSILQFKNQNTANLHLFKRLKHSEKYTQYAKAIKTALPNVNDKELILLEAQSELPEDESLHYLKYIIVTCAVFSIILLIMLDFPQLKEHT